MTAGPRLRSLASATVVAGALVAARALDTGRLATPPASSLRAVTDWLAAADPLDAAMSLLRFGVEVACWYLLAVAVVAVAAAFSRSLRVRRVAAVLAAPLPRRMARIVVGVSLATTTTPVALSGDQPNGAGPPTTMVALDGDHAAPGTATMVTLDGGGELASAGPARVGTASAGPVDDADTTDDADVTVDAEPKHPGVPTPAASTWTVAPGESFWVIAHETVTDLLGREASDTETAPYWAALVEMNRDRLVDPENPDLILPGQVFDLPATR